MRFKKGVFLLFVLLSAIGILLLTLFKTSGCYDKNLPGVQSDSIETKTCNKYYCVYVDYTYITDKYSIAEQKPGELYE